MSKPVRLVFLADDSQLRKALGRLVTDTSSVQASLKALQKTGADLQKIGRTMTLGITVPVAAAAGASVALAAQFESTMTKVQTLAGASSSQIQEWSKQLLALGPALGKTPDELANGLYFIVSSGAKASDALSILTASAKASAAGLGDTEVIANLVTSVMNAYGSENISASKATDVLTRAVKDGKAEATDLAGAVGLVIPLAAQLGVTFPQVAGAMAALTQTGASASEAATQLRGTLTEIEKPGTEAAGILSKIGLSAGDLQKEVRSKGLLAALDDLKSRTGTNSEEFARLFPNVRALIGVLSLTGPNAANVANVLKDVADAGGDVNAAFDQTKTTTLFKWHAALASLSSAGIQLGQQLAPGVQKVAEWVSRAADAFSKMDPHTKKLTLTIIGLVAAIGPLLYGFGATLKTMSAIARHPILAAIALLVIAFISAYTNSAKFRETIKGLLEHLKNAAHWFQQNSTVILSVAGAISSFLVVARGFSILKSIGGIAGMLGKGLRLMADGIVGAARIAGIAFRGLGLAWKALNTSFLFSPIGIVIALIVALAVAFIIAYQRSAAFRNFVQVALHDIAKVAQEAWHGLVVGAMAVWHWIDQYIVPVLKVLWNVAKAVFAGVMAVLGPPIKFFMLLAHIVGEAMGFVVGIIKSHWGVIKTIFKVALLIFFPIIGVVMLFIAIWKRWGGDIMAVLKFVWAAISFYFKVIWAIISFVAKAVWAVLSPLFKVLFTVISFALKLIWAIVSSVFKLIWAIIVAVVRVIMVAWKEFWNVMAGILKAAWAIIKGVIEFFVQMFDFYWKLITSIISTAVNAVKSVIMTVFNGVKNFITGIWNDVFGFFKGIWDKISGIASTGAHRVWDGIMGVWNNIKNAVSGAFSGIGDIIKGAINWAIDQVNKIHIPPVKVAGITVFDGWSGFNLPHLANGGFVDGPTVAMIGEAGKELVLPLTRKSRSMELLEQSGLLGELGKRGGSGHAAPQAAPAGKTVHIENINVTTTAKDVHEIGSEVAWQVRRVAL